MESDRLCLFYDEGHVGLSIFLLLLLLASMQWKFLTFGLPTVYLNDSKYFGGIK